MGTGRAAFAGHRDDELKRRDGRLRRCDANCERACGHVVMETYEDPAPRCACGQVVCRSCQEENHGIVCSECVARQEARAARKPPGVAPPPYHRRRTQTSS